VALDAVRFQEWLNIAREIDFGRFFTRSLADDARPDDEDQWGDFHGSLLIKPSCLE
jgi:hypothetical protein